MYLNWPVQPDLIMWYVLHCDGFCWYHLSWQLLCKVPYALMLLLASRGVFMKILCLELNYYSLNPKTILICIEQNITLISVIYISTDLKKTVSWLLRVLGRWKKDILKIISHRNLYLIHNTRGGVANTIKVLPI